MWNVAADAYITLQVLALMDEDLAVVSSRKELGVSQDTLLKTTVYLKLCTVSRVGFVRLGLPIHTRYPASVALL